MKLFTLLVLLVFSGAVSAAETKTFTWVNPTSNTDGSPFSPALDQLGTRVYCNIDPSTFVPQEVGVPQQAPIFSYAQFSGTSTTELVDDGYYECFATVINNEGTESYPSNVTTFTIGVPPVQETVRPEPPVLN